MMVAFHAVRLQKKISMLVLQVVQQSVFQLQRPASDITQALSCPNAMIPQG